MAITVKNINISMDDEVLAQIRAWADSPNENRTLSNAVETLCRRALMALKEVRGRIPEDQIENSYRPKVEKEE
mgnify:CR=1 FL=1